MGNWTLDDIPWDAFDPAGVDPAIVPLIKAASLVEYNAGDYRAYLFNVFSGDPRIRRAVEGWAEEETQHGIALARWAALADPDFDFEASFARFRAGFRLPLDADRSVRGSRSGELIARCMVETGTSSYYTALADATDEPVLRAICRHIASDEHAHYWLFHNFMTRYLADDRLNLCQRIRVAIERIAETDDDELSYAYYAANRDPAEPYDRRAAAAAYAGSALHYYTPGLVRRAVAMVFEAIGLDTSGWLARVLTRVTCWELRRRQRVRSRPGLAAAG